MTSEPLISVIIPTYKRAAHIPQAIESVRRQTYRNIEILVVDDGSPDNTATIIQEIPDSRIRYMRHDKNKGVSTARNTGIRAAIGSYIAFIDDDDEWREDKLEKQLIAIKDYDAVVCMGVANEYPTREHRSSTIALDDLRKGPFILSGLLTRVYVLKDVMFDENLKQGEDWDVFIRIGQQYSIGWMAEPLLIYNAGGHERATNVAKHLTGPELEKRAAVLNKHRKFLGERWYKHHLADTFLGYIGSRSDKLDCIKYAVWRCGIVPVVVALSSKVHERIRRLIWTRV